MTSMERTKSQDTATIANAANLSDEIDFRRFSMAVIHMPAAWTAASIGFKVSSTLAGTYLPLYDKNNSLVQISSPAVDQAHSVPAELAGAAFFKLWSQDGAGVNTNQAAERSIGVDLKS